MLEGTGRYRNRGRGAYHSPRCLFPEGEGSLVMACGEEAQSSVGRFFILCIITASRPHTVAASTQVAYISLLIELFTFRCPHPVYDCFLVPNTQNTHWIPVPSFPHSAASASISFRVVPYGRSACNQLPSPPLPSSRLPPPHNLSPHAPSCPFRRP